MNLKPFMSFGQEIDQACSTAFGMCAGLKMKVMSEYPNYHLTQSAIMSMLSNSFLFFPTVFIIPIPIPTTRHL